MLVEDAVPLGEAAIPIAADIVRHLAALRAERPLVQAITNFVSMDVTANALLAIGASPAMVHAPQEAADFCAIAGALVINIGTLDETFIPGMLVAVETANRLGKPWVLDPVGAGATRYRDETVGKLLAFRPTIIRGNASEILAVARVAGLSDEAVSGKGVDSAHGADEARAPAAALGRRLGCIVAATGAVDVITDGERSIELANGSPLMAKVTALGCALSGIVAAFAATTRDPLAAAVAAVGVYGVVGEMAAEVSQRPGSFRSAFLDALDAVGEADILRRLKVA